MAILFVSLGLGSVIVSAIEFAPWLAPVSRHKDAVFAAVGALLVVNYWLAVERPRKMNCAPGEICHPESSAARLNRALFWTSAAIYAAAVAVTYVALLFLRVRS
jgi:hypothetical protein